MFDRVAEKRVLRLACGGLAAVSLLLFIILYYALHSLRRLRSLSIAGTAAMALTRVASAALRQRTGAQLDVVLPLLAAWMGLSAFSSGIAFAAAHDGYPLRAAVEASLRLAGLGLVAAGLRTPLQRGVAVGGLLAAELLREAVMRRLRSDDGRAAGKAVGGAAAPLSQPAEPARAPPAASEAAAVAAACLHAAAPACFADAPPTPISHPEQRPASASTDCDLVRSGHVRNSATGRIVKIGGATFKRLLAAGCVVNRAAGTLAPLPVTTPTVAGERAAPRTRQAAQDAAPTTRRRK